jgi:hypothetical protein
MIMHVPMMEWLCQGVMGCDSRMSPDLLRGMISRLVEISMLMMKALNNISSDPCSHYTTAPLVTNPCAHELASPRRLCPYKRIENTSKNMKEQSQIADE